MAFWTQIENNASFNIIKDGKPVDAKTVNHALDNIEGNLQYLYEEVEDLKRDKGAVVVYGAPTAGGSEFTDLMRPGTPVYWIRDGGYWSPAVIDLRDPAADEEIIPEKVVEIHGVQLLKRREWCSRRKLVF